MSVESERESMDFDVVVVGAGPAGLATAIRLKQLAMEAGTSVSVCVLEKGADIGAHILSGDILETRALAELFPGWSDLGAPVRTSVTHDEFRLLTGPRASLKVPNLLVPATLHNRGNYVVSLGELCRWLGDRAAELGVDVLPGFAASRVLYDDAGAVAGVCTGDRGVAKSGARKSVFEPGIELRAKQTVLAEGARGHLGRELIERFALASGRDPQHYGIGFKELWEVAPRHHRPGFVLHGVGWPLSSNASGGFFLYHFGKNEIAIGLIVDLNYENPWLSPFDEFQRLKHHSVFADVLRGGRRIAYGARAIAKGGLNALPRMSMPGALLIGCDAGTLDVAKIKGSHTAMKSGIVAAETIFDALQREEIAGRELASYGARFEASWAYEDLRAGRNAGPALHRFGSYGGGAFVLLEQTVLRGRFPFTLHEATADHDSLQTAASSMPIQYAAPDGIVSFDMASSVHLSGTHHDEDQPCHLTLKDAALPVSFNLPEFGAPEQRYCPAGVYEILDEGGRARLQINAQNCLHCKVCDIKDPRQNIVWVPPEGGGPAYLDM